MTHFLLGRLGAGLVLLAALLVTPLVTATNGPLRTRYRRHLARLDRELLFLKIRVSSTTIVFFQTTSAALAAALAVLGAWPFVLILCVATLLPRVALQIHRSKRVALLEQQLESWLVTLANALRANSALGEALSSTAALMKEPIKSEIDLLIKEYQLGSPLDEALAACAERVGSRTFKIALFTLRVARNTGGNLAHTLSTTAKNLREMARLDGVVRTKTAEGKAQALVMSLVPVPLYLMVEWLSPGFFDPLKHTFMGQVICLAAISLWGAAFVLAQHILDVDI